VPWIDDPNIPGLGVRYIPDPTTPLAELVPDSSADGESVTPLERGVARSRPCTPGMPERPDLARAAVLEGTREEAVSPKGVKGRYSRPVASRSGGDRGRAGYLRRSRR
jgi:hypothetical protein